jgi:hypothetical protein
MKSLRYYQVRLEECAAAADIAQPAERWRFRCIVSLR